MTPLSFLNAPEPPPHLLPKILQRIHTLEQSKLRRRRIGYSIATLFSFIGLVGTFLLTHTAIIESGFGQFLSLIFSDFGILSSSWGTFGMTLLETLPVTSFILCLTAALAFLSSLRAWSRTRDERYLIIPHSYGI